LLPPSSECPDEGGSKYYNYSSLRNCHHENLKSWLFNLFQAWYENDPYQQIEKDAMKYIQESGLKDSQE
jgi:hypothetical protein